MPRRIQVSLLLAWLAAACATARSPAVPPLSPADATAAAGVPDRPTRRASSRAIADYLRARLAEDSGQVDAAADGLRLALVHDPDSPQLRISYAEALARAGRLERAEGEARRAVELADSPAATADAWVVLAKVLWSRGHGLAAERAVETAARLEAGRFGPDEASGLEEGRVDPEPWRVLALLRASRGDTMGAVAACRELATLDPAASAAVLQELRR